MRDSVQPRVQSQEFLENAMDFCLLLKIKAQKLLKIWLKVWVVNIAKNILIMLNNLQQMNLFKMSHSKNSRNNFDLIENKTCDKIIRVSKTSPKNNSETIEEILKEKYISPELRQKFIHDLRLREDNFWWIKTKERKLLMI